MVVVVFIVQWCRNSSNAISCGQTQLGHNASHMLRADMNLPPVVSAVTNHNGQMMASLFFWVCVSVSMLCPDELCGIKKRCSCPAKATHLLHVLLVDELFPMDKSFCRESKQHFRFCSVWLGCVCVRF